MSLFPFTPTGVEDKLRALYALSDAQLLLQAIAIENNFKQWIADSFILDNTQLSYLNGMADKATDYYGQQCSLCFQHRLEIELVYPGPPQNPSYAKWTVSSNNIEVETDASGNMTATGSLTFTLVYR